MKRHFITYLGAALIAVAVLGPPISPSAVSVLVTLGAGLVGAGSLIGTGMWLDDAADDIRAVQRGTPGARWTAAKGWHLPEGRDPVAAAVDRFVASDDENAVIALEAELDAALRPNQPLGSAEHQRRLDAHRKWQAARDHYAARRGAPPTNIGAPIEIGGMPPAEVRYEPVYTDQSPDPVDFIEVPHA